MTGIGENTLAQPVKPPLRERRACLAKLVKNRLTLTLEDARDDLSRSKQRLSKFLLRHGLAFDERTPTGRRKGNWTRAHWSWIESIRFAEGADNEVLAYYVDAVRRAAEEKARLEGLVEGEAGLATPIWTIPGGTAPPP